jgi:hypothetical protein
MEVGYIGRRIEHEFQPMALNTVPYMMTLNGQQFKQAYANTVLQYCGGTAGLAGGNCAANAAAVQPQAFFETALAGTGYCTGFATCTAAVVANEGATGTGNLNNAQVFSLWSDLDAGVGCPGGACTPTNGGTGAFAFPRSMMNTPIPASVSPIYGAGVNGQASSGVQIDASTGHANYNGAFLSVKMADWKGITMQSNLTWSKALGVGTLYQAVSAYAPLDSFDLNEEYGRQPFDRKIAYNAFLIYQPPFFKGQSGPMGRLLGGWTLASVFTAGSGTPVEEGTTFCCAQEFGGADNVNFGTDVNAVPVSPGTEQKYHANYNQPSSGLPVNGFKTGTADSINWRNPILGLDSRDCGAGCVSGQNFWNMDFSIKKNVLVAEGISVELQGVFTNVFGHNQWFDGEPCLCNPTAWGALPGQANPTGPRNVEVGLRFKF